MRSGIVRQILNALGCQKVAEERVPVPTGAGELCQRSPDASGAGFGCGDVIDLSDDGSPERDPLLQADVTREKARPSGGIELSVWVRRAIICAASSQYLPVGVLDPLPAEGFRLAGEDIAQPCQTP